MKLFRSLVAVWVVAGLSAGECLKLSAASGFPAGAPTARGSLISPAFAGGAPAGSIYESGQLRCGVAITATGCVAMARTQLSGLAKVSKKVDAPNIGETVAAAQTRNTFSDDAIANAIRSAEGKTFGVYRYGIRTASGEADGRRRCLATIRANRTRWATAGAHGEFIDFLADRYCPPSVDPVGNSNWKKNVRYFLSK